MYIKKNGKIIRKNDKVTVEPNIDNMYFYMYYSDNTSFPVSNEYYANGNTDLETASPCAFFTIIIRDNIYF